MSAFTGKVAAQCLTEFARFNNGQGQEGDDPFAGFVGEYWKFGLNIPHRDGTDDIAWSSAFICFVMRKSGAGNDFFYDGGHCQYVVKAIRDANASSTTAKFLGRDPRTQAPKVGDLINAGRAGDANVTFDNVLKTYGSKPVPKGNFISSHSDIVIAVDAANKKLTTIGGNVSNSVGRKTWLLNSNGTLVKGPALISVIETLL